VIEPVGFLARQRKHLLCARREIAHGFVAHTRNIMQPLCHFVQYSLENFKYFLRFFSLRMLL
jgi:hypothetical protein